MSDDRINSVSIVVTTKDAGVIGEESHRDVRSADDLHRVLTYMAPLIEQRLKDRGLLPAPADVDHDFDTRGRLFVYVERLDEVLDQ